MSKINDLKRHLKSGEVYRRSDLMEWSKAVDRHLAYLVADGTLHKLSSGLYYYPTESVFGSMPPNEEALVRSFLKEDSFLLTSPNDYNSLGVGTTQLYNTRVVYNHKRHGEFQLGGKVFLFQSKHRFPKKATPEFLLVDLVNNLNALAEDPELVLSKVSAKMETMDLKKLKFAVKEYANVKTKSFFNLHFKQIHNINAA
jgi:hypothetical protein